MLQNKKKKWTESDLKKLNKLIKKHSAEEISKIMGRSVNAIILRASRSKMIPKDRVAEFHPKKHIHPPKIRGSYDWRQHPVHKNYYVSETGHVWNARLGREQAQFAKNSGHYVVKVATDRGSSEVKVSRLVAETWLNFKDGQVVLHKDRNKKNNDIANLIVTDKRTAGRATGHISRAKKIALYVDNRPVKIYRSIRQAALDNRISYQTIIDHLNSAYENQRHGKDFRPYTKPPRPKY